jgi:hypothetical protein
MPARLVVTPAFDPKTMTWFVDESSSPIDIGDVESLAEMQKRLPRGAEIVGYRTNSNVIGVASRRPPSTRSRPSLFSANLNVAPSDAHNKRQSKVQPASLAPPAPPEKTMEERLQEVLTRTRRISSPRKRVAVMASPWSLEEREMLDRMVKNGRSQAEIVRVLGTKTRNQVASRIYRFRHGQS